MQETFAFILGMLAGVINVIQFIPQAVKMHKTKRVEDISLASFFLSTFAVCCWFIYGLLINQFPLIAMNLVTLVVCLWIIRMKIKYNNYGKTST